MQQNAVSALLLSILIYQICAADLRLCSTTKDDRIVFPDDKRESGYSFNDGFTTETPANSTTSTVDELEAVTNKDSNITTTTELPDIGNRILVDTLPVCEPGFQLRAGRCRKSA